MSGVDVVTVEAWLAEAAGTLGRSHPSELARNVDGTA